MIDKHHHFALSIITEPYDKSSNRDNDEITGQNGSSTELRRRQMSSVPGSPSSRVDQSFFSSGNQPGGSRKGYQALDSGSTADNDDPHPPSSAAAAAVGTITRSPSGASQLKCLQKILYHPNRKKLEEEEGGHELQPMQSKDIDDDGLEEINLLDNYSCHHRSSSESKDLWRMLLVNFNKKYQYLFHVIVELF